MDETLELETEEGTLSMPADATPAQAAAIAAAIGTHVRDQRVAAAHARATAESDEESAWDGERFQFAGRVEGLTGIAARVPRNAPIDKWTATGRLDRYDR